MAAIVTELDVVKAGAGCAAVLRTDELLVALFDSFDDETRACCAQVCKRWADLVLPILWRSFEELDDVMGLLQPIFVWKRDNGELVKRYDGTFDESDLVRWEYHVNMVQELKVTRIHRFSVSLRDIALVLQRTSFFPNLRKLNVSLHRRSCHLTLLYLLHGSIRELTMQFRNFKVTPTLLKQLPNRCPNIETLSVMVPYPYDRLSDSDLKLLPRVHSAFQNCLPELQCLRKLAYRTGHLTDDVLFALGKHPTLRSLELEVTQFDYASSDDSLASWKGGHRFRSLEDLQLDTGREIGLKIMEGYFSSCTLQKLFLSYIPFEPSHHTPVLLPSELNTTSLTRVSISIISGYNDEPETPPLSSGSLLPLTTCPNICQLDISWEISIDIDDEHLQELISHWPKLTRLKLLNWDYRSTWHPPRLTLASFGLLARHCPRLEDLAICLGSIGVERGAQPPSTCLSHLQTVDLGLTFLYVDETEVVALCFSQILPASCRVAHMNWWDCPGVGLQGDTSERAVKADRLFSDLTAQIRFSRYVSCSRR